MEVTDVQYIEDEGYPLLKCTIDGRPALINAEQSMTLTSAGIVSLGTGFKDYVIEVEDLPEDVKPFFDSPLRGYTNDAEFFAKVFYPWVRQLHSS